MCVVGFWCDWPCLHYASANPSTYPDPYPYSYSGTPDNDLYSHTYSNPGSDGDTYTPSNTHSDVGSDGDTYTTSNTHSDVGSDGDTYTPSNTYSDVGSDGDTYSHTYSATNSYPAGSDRGRCTEPVVSSGNWGIGSRVGILRRCKRW